ncbi:hypothetical protein BLA29_012757 [Euroglyphus maynei]|uniref:Uncharacterized protein n=1 Tax=Euroglyphus maynei TaxID=6958 RepID=A0A1Y3BTJ1_EURMA|nr:hypothetical protein BLA29_012757 [Euroglyphus maynei]
MIILASPLQLESIEHDNGVELIERIENQGWDMLTNEWPPSPSSLSDNFYFQDQSNDPIDLRKIRLQINKSMIDKAMINSANCIITFKVSIII